MKLSFKIAALTAVIAATGIAHAATPNSSASPAPQQLALNSPSDEGRGPPPMRGDHRDGPDRDGHFRGPRGGMMGFGGDAHGPLMHELRGLKLSDAQSDSIDDIFVKHHKEQRELFKRQRDLHRSAKALDPTAKDFLGQSNKLADATGKLTQDSLRLRAKIASEVIATLTPEQVQTLQTRRAERAAHHADGEGRHGGPRKADGAPDNAG